MKNNLFIPKKIRVGFQARNDTYTKRLAYVIYYDNKGKLRKETSWESWRDKTIDPEEYDNVPTEGFVLNKNVGGRGGWYDERMAYVRVYDPRGFEFEITIPNLLYILENTSSIKGKGLEGEFVYSWNGADIVLLPTGSPDYTELQKFNEKVFANDTVKAKDLVIGGTYVDNRNNTCIYMGRYDYYTRGYKIQGKFFGSYAKMRNYCSANNIKFFDDGVDNYNSFRFSYRSHALYDECMGTDSKRYFFYYPASERFDSYASISGKLINVVSNTPVSNFSELFDKLEHQTEYSPLDESKNEIAYYTAEELYKRLRNIYYRKGIICHACVSYCELMPIDGDDKNCKVFLYNRANYDIELLSELGAEQTGQNPITTSIEKVVEVLKPYYIKRYLANGKFYDIKER